MNTWNSQNFNFDWFLCKAHNLWRKKVQRRYLSWHWRVMQNLKKNWLVVWKMTWGMWQIFTKITKVSKLEHWWDSLIQSRKCMSLKYSEELESRQEEWCKVWRTIGLSFQNRQKKLDKFWPQHSKFSKIFALMGSFSATFMLLELDKCKRVIFHDTEEIWRGIGLSSQNWHEEFDKFWPEHSIASKICKLMGSFWPKYIMFKLKRYWEVMFDRTEDWCKIWKKTDLSLQIFTGWTIAILF